MVYPLQATTTTTAQQLDISNVVGQIMPIFVLGMLFSMLMPMMREMTAATR